MTETDKPFFVLSDDRRLVLTDPFRTERQAQTEVRATGPVGLVKDVLRSRLRTYRLVTQVRQARTGSRRARVLEELRNETARRGQRLAVLHMPDRRQVLPREWQRTLECWPAAARLSWDLDKPNHLLGDLLDQHATPYLDLTEPFRQAANAGRSIYFETDWHLNPDGHRFVGSMLADWLRSESLLPR